MPNELFQTNVPQFQNPRLRSQPQVQVRHANGHQTKRWLSLQIPQLTMDGRR